MDGSRFRLGKRPALDGVRAIAVLAVMGIHANDDLMRGGYLGVQIFFVLSGFLITTLLLEESDRNGRISLPRFYARRALRLLPAIVAVVAACAVYAVLFPDRASTESYFRDAFAALFYWANWLFASVGIQGHILVHTWSLSIEEQFYLFWPIIVMLLLSRRVGFRGLLTLTLGGAAASALVRFALYDGPRTVDRLYFGTDTRVDALLIGCALAVLATWDKLPTGRLGVLMVQAAGLFGAAGVVYATIRIPRKSPMMYQGGYTLFALATATFLALLLLTPNGPVTRALSYAPLRWIGRVSYGIYLWHLPVFVVIFETFPEVSEPVRVLVSVIASFIVAALSFRYIEEPFLRRKERFSAHGQRDEPGPPVAAEPERA